MTLKKDPSASLGISPAGSRSATASLTPAKRLKNDPSASLSSRSAGASLTSAERLKLPHQLAPWGPQLSIFPEEIALTLGPLVQRVAALVGPFTHHHV